MPETSGRETDPALEELRHAVLATPPGEEIPADAVERVQRLPADRRREIARVLAAEDDPRLPLVGGVLLLEPGEEAEADRAFARSVVAGADLTGLFFGWVHGDRPGEALRRYLGISRALLERYPSLEPRGRDRADRFLCDESLGRPLEECSLDAVRERLLRLEADLETRTLEDE